MRRIGLTLALGLFVALHAGCDVAEQMATEQRVRLKGAAEQAIRDAADAGKKAIGDAVTGAAATGETTPAVAPVEPAPNKPVEPAATPASPAAPPAAAPKLKPTKPPASATDDFNTGAADEFGTPDEPKAP